MAFTLTEDAREYLDSGSTAMALALRIEARDGTVYGFTNIRRTTTLPDYTVRDLTVPETEYLSAGSLSVTNLVRSARPDKADNFEATLITGTWLPALSVEKLLLRGAPYTMLVYDWRTDTPLFLLVRGSLGAHTLDGNRVTFKMRSLAQQLQQEILETTSAQSRADWGDPELAFFNLAGNTADGHAARVTSTINSVDADYPRQRFVVTASIGWPADRFTGGSVLWTSGENSGLEASIMYYDRTTGTITLDEDTPGNIAAGDGVRLQIGPPYTIEQWRTFFGSSYTRFYAGEPGIPTAEIVQEVVQT